MTKPTKPGAWTPEEQAAIVAAYNGMLAAHSSGTPCSKAAINRWMRGDTRPDGSDATHATTAGLLTHPTGPQYRGSLAARSRGSIEAKLMNVSAVRRDLGLSVLPGYKPAGNYQKSLRDAVREQEAQQAA